MESDIAVSYSGNSHQKNSNYDEIFMEDSLKFADSLMDLKNLRKQLYSAADYFESSFDKDEHKQFVIESSKEYAAKAIVSTVDHLGSVADKLNKFLDEKANEFSETKIRFSCIEQKLKTFHGFIDLEGISQQSLIIGAPKYHKRYICSAEGAFQFEKSKVSWKNCRTCSEDDIYLTNKDNLFSIAFRTPRLKPQPSLQRKGHSRNPSSESSLTPNNFSFTRVTPNIEAGKRSVSPLRFSLKRSGSVTASPSSSVDKQRFPSEPRRAILLSTKSEMMMNREREMVAYTQKSKNLFKALLSFHKSRINTK